MANQQLVDYIKAQRAAGVSRPDLDKALTTAGWSAADMASAYAAADGIVPPAPVSAPAPKPVASVQPVQPLQPQQPVQMFRSSPLEPSGSAMTQTTMQMNVQGTPRRGWGMLLSVLIPIVLLAGAVAAAYLFVPQVREVVGFYLGTAEPVVEEVATTTPPNIQTDTTNGYSVTLPDGMTLAPASVYEVSMVDGEVATSALPMGSVQAGNLFVVSKIPFADLARGKEVYDYAGCCSGVRYWFDTASTTFKAESLMFANDRTTYKVEPLSTTTAAGTACTIARTIGMHTFYRIASGDEQIETVYNYFLPTSQGYMLRFMTKLDLDSGGADVKNALASLTLMGANETTVQCQ